MENMKREQELSVLEVLRLHNFREFHCRTLFRQTNRKAAG